MTHADGWHSVCSCEEAGAGEDEVKSLRQQFAAPDLIGRQAQVTLAPAPLIPEHPSPSNLGMNPSEHADAALAILRPVYAT